MLTEVVRKELYYLKSVQKLRCDIFYMIIIIYLVKLS